MNIFTCTGKAVKDVSLTTTSNGKFVANGTIAVRRDFKNQNGEYETDFINFVSLGKQGELMANYIKKGDSFGISGRLQIRKWDNNDGKTQYFTEIVVNSFDFPFKGSGSSSEGNSPSRKNKAPEIKNDGLDIDSSELPF